MDIPKEAIKILAFSISFIRFDLIHFDIIVDKCMVGIWEIFSQENFETKLESIYGNIWNCCETYRQQF